MARPRKQVSAATLQRVLLPVFTVPADSLSELDLTAPRIPTGHAVVIAVPRSPRVFQRLATTSKQLESLLKLLQPILVPMASVPKMPGDVEFEIWRLRKRGRSVASVALNSVIMHVLSKGRPWRDATKRTTIERACKKTHRFLATPFGRACQLRPWFAAGLKHGFLRVKLVDGRLCPDRQLERRYQEALEMHEAAVTGTT